MFAKIVAVVALLASWYWVSGQQTEVAVAMLMLPVTAVFAMLMLLRD